MIFLVKGPLAFLYQFLQSISSLAFLNQFLQFLPVPPSPAALLEALYSAFVVFREIHLSLTVDTISQESKLRMILLVKGPLARPLAFLNQFLQGGVIQGGSFGYTVLDFTGRIISSPEWTIVRSIVK